MPSVFLYQWPQYPHNMAASFPHSELSEEERVRAPAHAKMIVADNDIAVVGTINMDFRSFYLHFECGTVFYRGSVVDKVRSDILETIEKSEEIDEHWIKSYPWIKSIGASLLSLLIPLM